MRCRIWRIAFAVGCVSLASLDQLAAMAQPGSVLGQTSEHVDGSTVTSVLYQSTGLDGRLN